MQANAVGVRELHVRSGVGIGTIREILGGRSDPTLGVMLGLVKGLELHSVEELIAPLGSQLLADSSAFEEEGALSA